MKSINLVRCHRLINDAISIMGLNLKGLNVLTEAATGYYVFTPIIAALAGAERVFALTRDSRYGTKEHVEDITYKIAKEWNVDNKIEILFTRDDDRIAEADVITNSGFVRPLDKDLLNRLKKTAVISLMYDPWEFRPEDINLEECRKSGIPVMGINENHPDLQIFRYVGHLAMKLLFELDIEVFRSNIMVIGSREFGECTVDSLKNAGANVVNPLELNENLLIEYQDFFKTCDAIVLVEHVDQHPIISTSGYLNPFELKCKAPKASLIHIAGGVSQIEIETLGIPFLPSRLAPVGYMSLSTDYLGPRPLIDLHSAGLKVGEVLARKHQTLYSADRSIESVLNETSLALCLDN